MKNAELKRQDLNLPQPPFYGYPLALIELCPSSAKMEYIIVREISQEKNKKFLGR